MKGLSNRTKWIVFAILVVVVLAGLVRLNWRTWPTAEMKVFLNSLMDLPESEAVMMLKSEGFSEWEFATGENSFDAGIRRLRVFGPDELRRADGKFDWHFVTLRLIDQRVVGLKYEGPGEPRRFGGMSPYIVGEGVFDN